MSWSVRAECACSGEGQLVNWVPAQVTPSRREVASIIQTPLTEEEGHF